MQLSEIQRRVEEAKREAFLRRVSEMVDADPTVLVPGGELGHQLGLPYEQALSIVEELQSRGLLHRKETLDPPAGPLVHITRRGVEYLGSRRAA